MLKYTGYIVFISLILTFVIMKIINESSQGLLWDFVIYIIIAIVITGLFYITNQNFRALWHS
ncbi:hypothetical protein LFYK43_19270 [Ligilactobacillus salitolerans]|uniref:Uncharacterized protein n=1 Tax=Ligilactobacillus salitolerans TaxID=1808352 RepID=A0A401IVE5_9LACO|nr:hypothetical protein LFYK43_19270 [Ligilactobacillus salitolerans]